MPVKSRISRDVREPNKRGNEQRWLWPSLRIRKFESEIIDAGNSWQIKIIRFTFNKNVIYLKMIIR